MAFTNTYDVSTPANASAPSGGAAAIRLLKAALQERLNPDHYFEKSGDTVDDDTKVGYHRKATLMKLDADPTAVTDMGILYTKDVDGVPELFFLDENGVSPIQITSGGLLNSTGFISGDLLFTTNTGAKSGWTDKSTIWANKFIRVSATAGSTGGADTRTNLAGTELLVAASSTIAHVVGGEGVIASTSLHIHTISGYTGAGDNVPVFITVRIYQRD